MSKSKIIIKVYEYGPTSNIYNLFKKPQYKSKTKLNANSKTEIKTKTKNPKCKHYNYRCLTLNLF